MSKRRLLQVALDFIEVEDALRIVNDLRDVDVDVIELGTPLIKSYGLRNLNVIKKFVGNKVILADTKTADACATEAELVYSSGFDALTVLGFSDNEVIKSCIRKSQEFDLDVIVDMIGFSIDKLEDRLRVLVRLGVNIVNIHTGIDVQRLKGKRVIDFLDPIGRIISRFSKDLRFSLSGGIKPEDIPRLKNLDISLIVIGSAITKAENPREQALKAIRFLRG